VLALGVIQKHSFKHGIKIPGKNLVWFQGNLPKSSTEVDGRRKFLSQKDNLQPRHIDRSDNSIWGKTSLPIQVYLVNNSKNSGRTYYGMCNEGVVKLLDAADR
jgi:hypothetical protein